MLEISKVNKIYVQRSVMDRVTRAEVEKVVALDDVTLTVSPGDTVGIVGESGSGKTTLARVIVRLVDPDSGSLKLDGQDVLGLSGRGLSAFRRRVQLIYQDPYSSLNPALTVGAAIAEPAVVHGLVSKSQAAARVADLMAQVGLNEALAARHPRQLSGGQRQRVAIARALAAEPDVLIADEATSALDVSVQAQVLALLGTLQRDLNLTLIFISHQLATVSQLCARVAIMYRGRIVETGPTREVFQEPRHGYTVALLRAHPGHGRPPATAEPVANAPARSAAGSSCAFAPRCKLAQDVCWANTPGAVSITAAHHASCLVLPGMSTEALDTELDALGIAGAPVSVEP